MSQMMRKITKGETSTTMKVHKIWDVTQYEMWQKIKFDTGQNETKDVIWQ